MPFRTLRSVGAHRDGHRNGARPHRERKGQRVKRLAGVIGFVTLFARTRVVRAVAIRLPQSVQPVEITISPPPTCTTGREIPKNARIWVPMKIEVTIRISPLSAIIRASAARPRLAN